VTRETLVLGGRPIGLRIATELAARNRPVTLVGRETVASRAREAGLAAHESALEAATPSVDRSAATVVVATRSDARNLLLAVTAPRTFDADMMVALVNDPDRQAAFDDAGIETIRISRSVARAAANSVSVEASTPVDRAAEPAEREGHSG
jgi:Trk K+ transport system NAD-binding subunit